MAHIELAEGIGDDFDSILDHLLRHEAADPVARVTAILRAIDVLEFNPQIGRPSDNGMRELIIGRESQGYVAIYRFVASIDTVFVLAIRSQREAGFARNQDDN